MQRLAFYSRTRLHEITEALRSSNTTAAAATWCCCAARRTASWCSPACRCCATAGVAFKEIDADEARADRARAQPRHAASPAPSTCPTTRSGNCRQFAHAAEERGAGAAASQLRVQHRGRAARPGRARRRCRRGRWATRRRCSARFDAVVVCGGVDSAALLRPLGLRIPLAAVLRLLDQRARSASRSTRRAARVMDERYKVAISRLGNRVRVAGSAEIGGAPDEQAARRDPDALQGAARLVPGRGAAGQHRRRRAGMERRAARCCPTGRR